MKKKLFVQNAAVMSGTSLLLKVIGMFFRIWLSNRIGGEGMGLYQLIFSIYILGSTVATTGLSTAVTRLVTEASATKNERDIPRILRQALLLAVGLSVLSTVLFYLAAPLIGSLWIGDTRSIPALRILVFGFPFMGISATLKGYFFARRRAELPSMAQIFEQLTRIGITVWLFLQTDASIASYCFAIMLSDVLSEALSAGFSACCYAFERDKVQPPRGNRPPLRVTRRLIGIAAPITAGRYLNTILRTIENIQVPRCLAVFSGSNELGLTAFGNLKGMAMPLIFFPSSLLSAFSTLLIPEMSEALALGQHLRVRHIADTTIRITMAGAWLCAGCFWLLGYPLGELFYGSKEVGFYIRVLAPLVPLMYLESVVDGILKGLNQQAKSLKYSLIDSALRILLIALVVPRFGMRGFLYIMVLSNLLTCLLNTGRLCRVTHLPVDLTHWLLRPLGCTVIGCALAQTILFMPFFRTSVSIAQVVIGALLCAGCTLVLFLLSQTIGFELLSGIVIKKASRRTP